MFRTVPIWHIPLLCVQWKTPDDGQRNCPKHVEFYWKNKFEKWVHLVGIIIRINFLFFKNFVPLWDNVAKYCITGQATWQYGPYELHAQYLKLQTRAYFSPLQQKFHERASMSRYTSCLIHSGSLLNLLKCLIMKVFRMCANFEISFLL